ncbi:methyl-accepting chemotaxis protein [Thalassotalea sediminis]|uniref:methyl-accepting chemotaxis protein n=1 Tax=Thalassotalea sediminis TaxID=1759089 RepID=UPI002572F1FC|nr:methyl-accepting chemotaxis protein [Thalassotalea sediminis]
MNKIDTQTKDNTNTNNDTVAPEISAAGRDIDNLSSKLAINSAEISFFLAQLSNAIEHSSDDVNRLATAAEQLSSNTNQINENATRASEQATEAQQATHEGALQLQNNVSTLEDLNSGINDASIKMQTLSNKASAIQDITNVIDGISAQTNLLALNAAIEAARAGEQGRGFAVVADEVRALASKTAEATSKIGTMLSEISSESVSTSEAMENIVAKTNHIVTSMGDLSLSLQQVNKLISDTSDANEHISLALKEHDATTAEVSNAIANLHTFLVDKSTQTQSISEKADHLSSTTEAIFVALSAFETHSLIENIAKIAVTAAQEVGELFEQSILQGKISSQQLFDYSYREIADTNPQKYHTAFDQFTDTALPAIQEPLLNQHAEIIYAGAVDINGYFPTHNKCFSQPLTGNYDHDIMHNRTKRIFNDPTGIRCGQHTSKFLMQTYKRDTGEVMHDVSAPIMVNGQHWGGFRIGFKA